MSANTVTGTPEPFVRVDMLGPLRLVVGDEVVAVPGPKRRAVLALLATAEGRAVAVNDLLDALWPSDLPETARASLHSLISRLRSHLGPAAALLETVNGSYRLRLDEGGTDAARARSLLAAAMASDAAGACRLLSEARSLWRGSPLGEFTDVAALAARAVALDELRRAVEEAYAAAALKAGATADAVEVASALIAADPLSEHAVLLLMRALDAAGRGAEALRAGYDFRRRLADETGLDPSHALGDLEAAIAGRAPTRAGGVPPPGRRRLRGRDSELAALRRLVADEPLVTVLGPPGVGKTRLAAAVAAGAEHATAVWLTPVTDMAGIPHALAAALDLRVVHGDVLSACAALLAAGPHLLLIDNCEHLIAGVREAAAGLLDACPQLRVLATSREPLGLASEQRFRLSPLPVPHPDDLDGLARSPAVAVFVDRARRVRPDFKPTRAELDAVGDIVRGLDGMPLAIELAAGRLSSVGVVDLRDRLDRSLYLLGDQDMTLQQTIQWSYDLLSDPERRLFRQFSVFPDGFNLAAAEHVAAGIGLTRAAAVLGHLVDASMIEVVFDGPPRYRILDALRSFALNRLHANGEAEAATKIFIDWAIALAAWIDRTIDTYDEPRADALLRSELANLRAAWQLTRTRDLRDDAARMVLCLSDAAGWRDLTEVWDWALELADDPTTVAQAEAASLLGLAATCAWSRGELDRADRLARSGLERGGVGVWRGQSALALVALSRGDWADAVDQATEAAARATRTDQSLGVAALAAAYQGDLDEAAAINARLGTAALGPTIKSLHRYVAGEIDALAERGDQAEKHYEQAIALARECGATFVEGIASVGLVTLYASTGRVAAALSGYRALIDYWEQTGGWIQQWTTLRNLARLLRSLGDAQTAMLIDSAADRAPDAPAIRDETGPQPLRTEQPMRAVDTAPVSRARLLKLARQAIDRQLSGETSPRK